MPALPPVSTKSCLEQTPSEQLSLLLIMMSFTNHYCYTKISSFMSGKPARKLYISIERSESLGENTWATGEAVSVSRVTFHDSVSEARKTCYYTLLCRLKPYRYGCFEVIKALVTGNCLLKGPAITQIRGREPPWGRDLTSFFFRPLSKKKTPRKSKITKLLKLLPPLYDMNDDSNHVFPPKWCWFTRARHLVLLRNLESFSWKLIKVFYNHKPVQSSYKRVFLVVCSNAHQSLQRVAKMR